MTTDPWFLSGLIHTVAIDYDANAAGTELGIRAGYKPDWRQLNNFQALACRCVAVGDGSVTQDGRTVAVINWVLVYADTLTLGVTNRVRFADPGSGGLVRYLHPKGRSRVEGGNDHHAVCELVEYAA